MNDQSKAMEQLMLLKGTTLRTGAIHEAQRLQLELWPRMSDQIQSCLPKVNFTTKTIALSCITFGKSKFKMEDFEKKLFQEILGWVRLILWDDTRVIIMINKKRVFDSATH